MRLSEGIPDKSSIFADEGTAAHMLSEHCIAGGFDADRFLGMFVDIKGKTPATVLVGTAKHDRCFEVTDEMADAVQQYIDFVREFLAQGFEVQVEQRLDLTHLWPDQFGTGDCIAWDEKKGALHVADLKYGRGVAVDPEENPQGLSYASGAARRYHNRGVKSVSIHIIQPRAQGGGIKSWTTTPERLAEFEHEFREAAKQTALPDAPLNPGEWCRFCPAAATCPARRDASFAVAQAEFGVGGEVTLAPVAELSADALGTILRQVDELETWCRRVREHAHDRALHGEMPTGFKLVANRATRKWRNPDQAKTLLQVLFDLDEQDVLTAPELLSPAKIEAKLPGKNKAERAKQIDSLIDKRSTGTVLAPLEDKRPPVKADAAGEFGDVS